MNMNAIDLKGSEFAGMRGAYAAFAKRIDALGILPKYGTR